MRRPWPLLAIVLIGAACGPASPPPPSAPDFTTRPSARRFALSGRVVSLDPAARQVTLAHDRVEGFMDAMTMPFVVREEADLARMKPGDLVTATLVVDGARAWLEGVTITHDPRGTPPSGTARGTWVPAAPGTPLPDVTLVDAGGARFRVADRFRGAPLLLAFSYTRCPLAEFCPLIMERMAQVERATAAGPLAGVRLLTVTLDPGFDTPARLDAYGAVHVTGTPADRYARWTLATGAPDHIRQLAAFAGLDYFEAAPGRIHHSLRVVVVDEAGRLRRTFEHSGWTVAELLDALQPQPQAS